MRKAQIHLRNSQPLIDRKINSCSDAYISKNKIHRDWNTRKKPFVPHKSDVANKLQFFQSTFSINHKSTLQQSTLAIWRMIDCIGKRLGANTDSYYKSCQFTIVSEC